MAFEGIVPAVTTPFTAADEVDVPALKENIEKLIEAGVHGFVATGTMGEAGSLTRAGRALGVRLVGGGAPRRGPGPGGISPRPGPAWLGDAPRARGPGAPDRMSPPPPGV